MSLITSCCVFSTQFRVPGRLFRPALTVVLLLTFISSLAAERKRLTLAAVGPLTGSAAVRGKDLEEAVRLAVDEINASGGINGNQITLDVYDDGDNPDRARELAVKIATTTPALAVLGQVASAAGIAAGEVYKREEIPAITGAASQSTVTKDNDWFFRLLPDAVGQGRFLADYARYRYATRQIAVIRETGTAGDEFALAFRDRAKSEGIRIFADLELLTAEAHDSTALASITSKLAKMPKGGLIVLGTQYAETPLLLKALRDALGPFAAMGYSSVATEGLSAQFAEAEKARRTPGYYTDGLTVAAPQLPDVAEYAQTRFASRFEARYHNAATPEAVRWYESAQLIFQAIGETGIDGSDTPSDRRKIRDWLAKLNRPETAAAGVAGPIYFDHDHNVQRGISVGIFYGGHLISAPVQFTLVTDPDQVPGWERLQSENLIFEMDTQKVIKTPVVYSGIELNSLDNIDVRTGSFAADFFLWFRYSDGLNLDPHEVEFPTIVSGGQLGQEVLHRAHNGFITSTYHVKGVFRADYEFSRFPFDHQELKIPLQIRNSSSYSMILAYGGLGSRAQDAPAHGKESKVAAERSPLSNKLWRFKDQIFYRDVVSYQSSFGEQPTGQAGDVQVNRINSQTTIERDVFGFAIKNFLPLACILIAVLIGYALAADVINPRVSIGVTALLTTSVLYQKMASDLPSVTYITAIDDVFFAFFGICVTFLALTVVTYETHKAKLVQATKLLNYGGAGITIVGLVGTLIFVWLRYWGRG